MSQGKKKEEKKKPTPQIEVNIDARNYIASYSGHAILNRLVFLADVVKGKRDELLDLLVEEVKKTDNAKLFRALAASEPQLKLATGWSTEKEKEAAAIRETLEATLTAAKGNMVKEDIRNAHRDLGTFYYERGDLSSALKCYIRMRDYCSTSAHIVDMCTQVCISALELKNYSHVHNHVSKAEQTDVPAGTIAHTTFKVVSGVAHLATKKYRLAARAFLNTNAELLASFDSVVSVQDVAYYAGLCALATFNRSEIHNDLLENSAFKGFLSLVPNMNDIIRSFYNSQYNECFQKLEQIKPFVQVDIFLADHVDALYRKIRNKALVQYFSPFSSVKLEDMSAAFNGIAMDDLEEELRALINEDLIQARIDSYNKVLYAKKVDQRTATFKKAIAAGQDYQENCKEMLLRMNVLMNEVQVRSRGGGGAHGHGGGGGGQRGNQRAGKRSKGGRN